MVVAEEGWASFLDHFRKYFYLSYFINKDNIRASSIDGCYVWCFNNKFTVYAADGSFLSFIFSDEAQQSFLVIIDCAFNPFGHMVEGELYFVFKNLLSFFQVFRYEFDKMAFEKVCFFDCYSSHGRSEP